MPKLDPHSLASIPTDLPIHRFAARDGVELVWRETGSGRAVVLIHGLFSDAVTNWIKFGHAARIAAAGFRVIMPDLRGHGDSTRSHDPAAYPPDVLADDGEDLIAHLGLTDFDLGGYSLGGRTVVRMLVRGAAPRRAIISGMGLAGLLDTGHRAAHFRLILDGIGTHRRGSPGMDGRGVSQDDGRRSQGAAAAARQLRRHAARRRSARSRCRRW